MLVSFVEKNKYLFCFKIVLIFFLLNGFLPTLSADDKITQFLENVIIRESGAFTLLGTKPMTEFDVAWSVEEQEEDYEASYQELKLMFKKTQQSPSQFTCSLTEMPSFSEYKNKCLSNKELYSFLKKKELWENWLANYRSIASANFKLTMREHPYKTGILINVPQAIYILKKYHADFVEQTQIEFDLATILDTIDDHKSSFWNSVFTNHYLHGLLLGFGEKNAFIFDYMKKMDSLKTKAFSFQHFAHSSEIYAHGKEMMQPNVSIENLVIPYFVTYDINDDMREKYLREKGKIIDYLKEKNLVDEVLKILKL